MEYESNSDTDNSRIIGIIARNLEKRLNEQKIYERIETRPTTELLKSFKILKIDLETWGDLLSLRIQWKTHKKQVKKTLSNSNKYQSKNR